MRTTTKLRCEQLSSNRMLELAQSLCPFVGVSGRWTSSWMEYPEQAQLRSAGILDAMKLSARQKNARASLNRGARFACPHPARAL